MKSRFAAGLALLASVTSTLACSAGSDGGSGVSQGSGASGGSSNKPVDLGTGGGLVVNVAGTDSIGTDPNDPRPVPVRQKTCDAAGNCTCLRLALLGTLESAATAKDTKPFIDWLNDNSGGTATVQLVATKPSVSAAFLADYDILVVANVNGWTFSADEKAAVEKWVREAGGGIITLTGFVSQKPAEPLATSQLTQFAGIGYTELATAPASGQSSPVFYKGGATDLKTCLTRWNGPGDDQAGITTPIKFVPQTGSLEKLTASLDYVGAFIGWSVTAPAGATVVAKDPVSGLDVAVAYEVDGTGRIFAFGDEWVVFANQWQPSGQVNNMQMDGGNTCWQPPVASAAGFFHSAQTLYQTKQFWYNAINWVAPPNQCNFVVNDVDVVVK